MKLILRTSWLLDDDREVVVQRFPFVIGRRTKSDYRLMLPFVSRRHCRFTRTGDRVLVQDLESYNGTFVNGKRVRNPLPLRDGDELSLGHCSFRVSMVHDTTEVRPLP
jgi:pSer/pThr/pTyr-binding forkhead associated (FHA) protein